LDTRFGTIPFRLPLVLWFLASVSLCIGPDILLVRPHASYNARRTGRNDLHLICTVHLGNINFFYSPTTAQVIVLKTILAFTLK
jgi:hypothetical protein